MLGLDYASDSEDDSVDDVLTKATDKAPQDLISNTTNVTSSEQEQLITHKDKVYM